MVDQHEKYKREKNIKTQTRFLRLFTPHTGAREENIIKVRVRKNVSIPLKAPEAALFKYVN